MKAICVTGERKLEVRDIPTLSSAPPGHVLVELDSATITHGDKFFLTHPLPGGGMVGGKLDVYGSNGAGKVVAIGADVPARYLGSQVAIYKTLVRSAEAIGIWSEQVLVPYRSCLVLPEQASARDYNGSFANVLTVYAFLSDIRAAGHKGIVVTAGTSATGRIAAVLARRQNLPAIFLVRSHAAREELLRHGVEHVLVTGEAGFDAGFAALAAELKTTAVFDGLGGAVLNAILPHLPMHSTVFIYGFLGGAVPVSFPAVLVMSKNLTLRRFSNLESPVVTDPDALAAAMRNIEGLIDDPLCKTKIGAVFHFHEADQAMAYEGPSGARAILVP